MGDFKKTRQIWEPILLAAVPVVLTTIARMLFGDELFTSNGIILTIVVYLISALFVYLFNKYISQLPLFRKYKKYEGKWIEIIPDFSHKISICTVKFDKEGYHFNGTNYSDDNQKPVEFFSRKFVDNGENSFFYITKSNQSYRPEGFGKVYALSKSDEGFYKAKGYFCNM